MLHLSLVQMQRSPHIGGCGPGSTKDEYEFLQQVCTIHSTAAYLQPVMTTRLTARNMKAEASVVSVQGIQMLIEKFLQRAEDWARDRDAALLAVLQCEPPDDSQQASGAQMARRNAVMLIPANTLHRAENLVLIFCLD